MAPPPPPRPFRPYQTIPGDLSSAAPLPGYIPTPNPTANWSSRQTHPAAAAPRPFRSYQTIPGDLSSAAPLPSYTPAPNPTSNFTSRQPPGSPRPYQTIPGDLSSARPLPNYTPTPNPTLNFNTLHPTHLPTHNPLTGRPYYDNRTPNIPSHFVPLYGAAHGMFYDPLTRLFYGDGPARPTLERPGTEGEMPVEGDTPEEEEEEQRQQLLSGNNNLMGDQPTDALHLQPRSVTAPAAAARLAAAEEGGAAAGIQRFYYSACVNRWLAEKHDCPADMIGEPVDGEVRMPPLGTVPPGVIRPGDVVREEEMTHEIRVGYLGYLTAEQRVRVRREWGV